MASGVLNAVIDSFRAPRRAARWVIDTFDRPEEAALLFALAYTAGLLMVFLSGMIGAGSGGVMSMGPEGLLGGFISFVILTGAQIFLIQIIGAAFGGTARPLQLISVISWHGIVTAPLNLFLPSLRLSAEEAAEFDRLFGPGADPSATTDVEKAQFLEAFVGAHAGGAFQMVVVGVIAIYIFANFIAEAHGFASAWKVAGVLMAGLFVAALILPMLLGGVI